MTGARREAGFKFPQLLLTFENDICIPSFLRSVVKDVKIRQENTCSCFKCYMFKRDNRVAMQVPHRIKFYLV